MKVSRKLEEIRFNKSRGERPAKPHFAINENGDMVYAVSESAALNAKAYKHLKSLGKGLISATKFTG